MVTVNYRLIATSVGAMMVSMLIGSVPAAEAGQGGNANASESVIIRATPKVVWSAVALERDTSPDVGYSKVLKDLPNGKIIEQKLTGIPMLGSVTAVTQHSEVPYKRIDYSLVRSDRFKKLEGSWVFESMDGGKATKLSLSSFVDVGVPFSGIFIKNATKKKISRRINHVKQLAEKEQARLAASGKTDL